MCRGCPGRAGLDGLGGILLADEDFQEAEFGLDPFVLPVLFQHRHSVLLLNISAGEEGDRREEVFLFSHQVPSDEADLHPLWIKLLLPGQA